MLTEAQNSGVSEKTKIAGQKVIVIALSRQNGYSFGKEAIQQMFLRFCRLLQY